jgi:2-polyprenyl-6-methoxyphenol hydroxylase-like FAD-dependent oxidoreductase
MIEQKNSKILISGAGTAGLLVAYWLQKYGFTPTIVESAPALRTGGYKIDIRGEALKVLHRTGIYDAVVAENTDMQEALFVDKNGKVIHKMSGNAFGHRIDDDQEIMRGTLNQILIQQIPQVEIIFGDTIEAVTHQTDCIEVTFKKNGQRNFDLLIGADGLHSNVRKLMFGDESKFLKDLGIYLCVFSVPNYLNLDRVEIEYTELGRVAGIWSSRGDKNAKAYFAFANSKQMKVNNTTAQQELVHTIFSTIGGEIPKLLNLMPKADDFYFDTAAQIHMECWFSNRTILLGDAAYCASPMSGQGTSLALIGAYVLAGELALAKGNHKLAFERFNQIMRPYVSANQELGIRAGKLFRAQEKKNPLSWLIAKTMMLLPGRLVEFFITRTTKRINKAANSITLKDYEILLKG